MKELKFKPTNFYLLDILDGMNTIVRTIEISFDELQLLNDLSKTINLNETGGITIRLKLKSKYVI